MAIKNNVKPDTVLKTFWKNNQRFADLFNTVLFDGNTILKPNDLKEADTDVSSIIKYDTFQRMYKNKELSTELGLTLGSVVNSQSIIKQVLAITEEGSDPNMTDPFDEMLEEMKRKEGEKARLKGRLEGKREGRLEGKLEGKIEGTINICKKFHVNQEETLRNLIEEFVLSDDKAREYMNMYW